MPDSPPISEIDKKIAILISWPREIDMFARLVESLGGNSIFLVNDLKYTERERADNKNNIIAVLKKNHCQYLLLSKMLGGVLFPIIVSTGLSFQERITVKSFLKYLYAILIGRIFEFIGMSTILEKITGKRFSAGGVRAVKFERIQPERKLAYFTVRYPKGLDLSRKFYPEQRWFKVFDLHLCHGDIDKKLIQKKFADVNCLKIGYPKYNSDQLKGASENKIRKEFSFFDDKKPLILWMPTHLKNLAESGRNISPWITRLQKLHDKFYILIRIHPKTLITNPDVATELESNGLIVDKKQDRNLCELYKSADLVLADFGASVLSAIYMKKTLLLLGFNPLPQSILKCQKFEYLDLEARKYIPVINEVKQITTFFKESMQGDIPNTLKIRELLFGLEEEVCSIHEVAEILLKKLHDSNNRIAIKS